MPVLQQRFLQTGRFTVQAFDHRPGDAAQRHRTECDCGVIVGWADQSFETEHIAALQDAQDALRPVGAVADQLDGTGTQCKQPVSVGTCVIDHRSGRILEIIDLVVQQGKVGFDQLGEQGHLANAASLAVAVPLPCCLCDDRTH
jgi:hypothetical protein